MIRAAISLPFGKGGGVPFSTHYCRAAPAVHITATTMQDSFLRCSKKTCGSFLLCFEEDERILQEGMIEKNDAAIPSTSSHNFPFNHRILFISNQPYIILDGLRRVRGLTFAVFYKRLA